MIFWIINILLTFSLCVCLSRILLLQILLVSFRKKLFDIPNERKVHVNIVPRLGGMAFKPVSCFSIILLSGLNLIVGRPDIIIEISNDVLSLSFGFCAIMTLYLMGVIDDLIGMRYRNKFTIQILCGLMLIAGGVWIDNLYGLFDVYALPIWIGYPLTLLVVVFIINAYNLIDGIDGLASGLGGICLFLFGLQFFVLDKYIYAMLAFSLLGVLIPFFYYNVFGNVKRGRKIFMGDTGSLTIGISLCFLSIKLSSFLFEDARNIDALNPLVLAYSPLIIPCFDVVRVYIERIRQKKSPFMPDKNHIHHRLLATGIPQRTAMIAIISSSVIYILLNIVMSQYMNVSQLLIIDALIWIVANIGITRKIEQRRMRLIADSPF